MKYLTACFLGLCALLLVSVKSQAQGFYDKGTMQEIRIYFSMSNWDNRMDTAKAGQEGYLLADSVVINEKTLMNCGVKYKGNSTYSPNRMKNPLHIKLDYQETQDYKGFEDVKLGNGWSDNSMIREPLAYEILRNYMKAPKSNFAKVWINGVYYGLMSNTEDIDKKFMLKHFRTNELANFKCTPSTIGGNGANLAYLGSNESAYAQYYEMKSDEGWGELIGLCDTLNNHFAVFDDMADTDRFLWMLAFNNATVNLDSYSGAFRQNYHLYRNHQDFWIPIIWDLNMAFGGFPSPGGITPSLTPTTMKTMSHTLHKAESGWPLIQKLLNDATYSKMYFAHLRTINQEQFASAAYKTLANELHDFVAEEVQNDPNSLTSGPEFLNSLTTDTPNSVSLTTSPGLFLLMDGRASFLSNVLSATPPAISDIVWTNSLNYGDLGNISAKVTNATAVFLGYRYATTDRFVRTPMYDDGQHNDGAAGDGIYGTSCAMSSLRVEYYLWAENAQTGAFSPARAEFEFHLLTPSIVQATVADVAVTELLANNENGLRNEAGKRRDWIEIHNKTNNPLGLNNLYLTKSANDLQRWRFPADALILPQQYLLVWADDLDTTYLDLHCNFNLAAVGDTLIVSDGTTPTIPIIFGALGDDIAWGRCPTIDSDFKELQFATPRLINNCLSNTLEDIDNQKLDVYLSPNPSLGGLVTFHSGEAIRYLQVFDAWGRMVLQTSEMQLQTSTWPSGVYIVRAITQNNRVVSGKLVR